VFFVELDLGAPRYPERMRMLDGRVGIQRGEIAAKLPRSANEVRSSRDALRVKNAAGDAVRRMRRPPARWRRTAIESVMPSRGSVDARAQRRERRGGWMSSRNRSAAARSASGNACHVAAHAEQRPPALVEALADERRWTRRLPHRGDLRVSDRPSPFARGCRASRRSARGLCAP
jgi:hypothetical protein